MRHLFAALVFALSSSAYADGVNLTSLPAPTLTSQEQLRFNDVAARTDADLPYVVTMNAAALDSTIVNVTIAGTNYRLVGVKTNRADGPNVDIWKGSGPGATATFMRYSGNVRGYIHIGPKTYAVTQIGTSAGATFQVKSLGAIVD